MFMLKIGVLAYFGSLIGSSTFISKEGLLGVSDAKDMEKDCIDFILNHIESHSCKAQAVPSSYRESHFLNALFVNSDDIMSRDAEIPSRISRNRYHRITRHRSKRSSSCTHLPPKSSKQTPSGRILLNSCQTSIESLSHTCKLLMCNMTHLYKNSEVLASTMTWQELSNNISYIWSHVQNSCPSTNDCITDVYNTLETCFNIKSKGNMFDPSEIGYSIVKRKTMKESLHLMKSIHNAFCMQSSCIPNLVTIFSKINTFTGGTCSTTTQMTRTMCRKHHWKKLGAETKTDKNLAHCAGITLLEISRLVKELDLTDGPYQTISQQGDASPFIKIRNDYKQICSLLLQYNYWGTQTKLGLGFGKFEKEKCNDATLLDDDDVMGQDMVISTNQFPPHVVYSQSNTDIQFGNSGQIANW